jgi:hypothetical protein
LALINGEPAVLIFKQGKADFPYTFKEKEKVRVEISALKAERLVRPIPLVDVGFAPFACHRNCTDFQGGNFRFVHWFTYRYIIIWFFRDVGIVSAFFNGLLMIIDTYIPEAIMDRGHVSIIIFSMLIGAMVNLITRNGGMKGIVNVLSRFASTPRSGQFATWLMGIAIFFDDYANTLVVGNTMQPVTDRLKTSREKLAYIVDSTAAPMAAIAFVTTWIGAQLSYIADGIRTLELNETPTRFSSTPCNMHFILF